MFKVNTLGKGVSQYLAMTKKLGNVQRAYVASNGTNLKVLMILVRDIETNLCPRHRCGFCKKVLQKPEKWIMCEDCKKSFHTSCSKINENKGKSRKCHNHKPQPFPDPKRKRKQTNPNKHKSNKRTMPR